MGDFWSTVGDGLIYIMAAAGIVTIVIVLVLCVWWVILEFDRFARGVIEISILVGIVSLLILGVYYVGDWGNAHIPLVIQSLTAWWSAPG